MKTRTETGMADRSGLGRKYRGSALVAVPQNDTARTVERAKSPHHKDGRTLNSVEETVMNENKVSVGVDVSKSRLDAAVIPSEKCWSVDNDEKGIKGLVRQLKKIQPDYIVIEATGGYEAAVAGALAGAGLPVSVVNPANVRNYAKASGVIAKTDTIDSLILV